MKNKMMTSTFEKKNSPQSQAYESLLVLLADHASPTPKRLPTLNLMARQFGVGISAVRQAVNKLEAQGYLSTRQGSGIFTTGRTTHTLRIGLFGRAHGHLWEDIARELINTFGINPEIVLTMIPFYENETADKELARIQHRLLTDGLDVMLAVGMKRILQDQLVINELQSQVKIIDIYNQSTHTTTDSKTDSKIRGAVLSDQTAGHKMATQHLINIGCRKILILSHGSAPLQEEACRQVTSASEHDVSVYIHQGSPNTQPNYASDVVDLLCRHKHIDGIHGFSDFRIAKVVPALKLAGYQLPQDIKLIGYGDTAWSELMDVPLSTVNTQPEKIAKLAYDMIRHGDLSQRHHVKPRLVIRQSTIQNTH